MEDDSAAGEVDAHVAVPARDRLDWARALVERAGRTSPHILWLLIAVFAATTLALAISDATRSSTPTTRAGLDVVSSDATTFWTNLDKRRATGTAVDGPEGERALQLTLRPGRKYFTILQKTYSTPLDWRGRPYFLLNYHGTGGGGTMQLIVDFEADNGGFAVYNLHDTTPKWRQLAFSTSTADAHNGKLRWGHIVGFRIVGDKRAIAKITVGELKVAPPTRFGS